MPLPSYRKIPIEYAGNGEALQQEGGRLEPFSAENEQRYFLQDCPVSFPIVWYGRVFYQIRLSLCDNHLEPNDRGKLHVRMHVYTVLRLPVFNLPISAVLLRNYFGGKERWHASSRGKIKMDRGSGERNTNYENKNVSAEGMGMRRKGKWKR